MKYGPIAENTLEARVLAAPAGPRVGMDVLLSLLQAKSIMVCARLGVFDLLREQPRTAEDIAATMQLDPEMVTLILRILWGGGYVSKEPEGYALTPFSRAALVADSKTSRSAHAQMCELFWGPLGDLETALRSGVGVDAHRHLQAPQAWSTYQGAMLEDARAAAQVIVPFVPVRPGATRLLDVAGSHGLYGAALCRANPPLCSEVMELPQAIEHSRALAAAQKLCDVVTHREGNALTDDLGADYDVVLFSNILHHLTAEQSRVLLAKARDALRPGGTVAIWEFDPPGPESPPDILRDGLALFFRAVSPGRCHSAAEYALWLESAGFTSIRTRRSMLISQQVLVVGRVAAATPN
jgi:SAM-dependent methyltransferase